MGSFLVDKYQHKRNNKGMTQRNLFKVTDKITRLMYIAVNFFYFNNTDNRRTLVDIVMVFLLLNLSIIHTSFCILI